MKKSDKSHPMIDQVKLGRTNVIVSEIGLGTAPLGSLYGKVSEADAIATIQRAYERGITHFDTAPLYGIGYGDSNTSSEELLGNALAGISRERYTITTKVGRVVNEAGNMVFDFSRDGVMRSIEQSLTRLKMDRVDVLLVHDPDVENKFDDALNFAFPTLIELREQGVVGAIGAGMNQWEMPMQFVLRSDPDCFLLAGRYTLLEQTSLEFLRLCIERKIGIFAGGTLNSGILATGAAPGAKYNYQDAPNDILDRVKKIETVCTRHGIPLRVAALQFPAAHPAITSRVFGAVTASEVDDNLDAMSMTIPSQLWQDLRDERLIDANAPVPHPEE
jgi:D-threo-aldose 1-dehydrogenase